LSVKNPNFADYQLFQRKTHDFRMHKFTQNHQKPEKLPLFLQIWLIPADSHCFSRLSAAKQLNTVKFLAFTDSNQLESAGKKLADI
jgi:hypothetical protein